MAELLRKGNVDGVPCYLVCRPDLPIVLALRSSWVFDRPIWVEFCGNEIFCITVPFTNSKFRVDPYLLRRC